MNIDVTTDAIQKAVEQAQSMIEEKIKSVFVGIAGNHIRSFNSQYLGQLQYLILLKNYLP